MKHCYTDINDTYSITFSNNVYHIHSEKMFSSFPDIFLILQRDNQGH